MLDNKQDKSIDAAQKIQKYNEEKKELYSNLIIFLDSTEDIENDFQNLIDSISTEAQEENGAKFEQFFQMITNIANNHHRDDTFFPKIFRIIEYYKDIIKKIYSNAEIYKIFQSNKKILLYLFEHKIITVDDEIYKELLCTTEANGNRYCHFFYPEIKEFKGVEKIDEIESELLLLNDNILDNFQEKREKGENETYVCSLIREDSIEEFVSYVNTSNILITSEVIPSLFETNSFLNENYPTLIEYSCFFGSIQIFQFLRMNNVKLTPSLWLYAIHSRNSEMIHLLESLKVAPPNDNFEICLIESVKCHHNEFADFFEANLMPENYDIKKSEDILSTYIHYRNFAYFPSEFESCDAFYYLCSYGYKELVDLFMKKKEKQIKEELSKRITNDILFINSQFKMPLKRIELKLSTIYCYTIKKFQTIF